jgi:hypothetical protein
MYVLLNFLKCAVSEQISDHYKTVLFRPQMDAWVEYNDDLVLLLTPEEAIHMINVDGNIVMYQLSAAVAEK